MVRPTPENGLSRNHDVPPIPTHQAMDRKGYRAAAKRGFYMAESLQGECGSSEEYWEEGREWGWYGAELVRIGFAERKDDVHLE